MSGASEEKNERCRESVDYVEWKTYFETVHVAPGIVRDEPTELKRGRVVCISGIFPIPIYTPTQRILQNSNKEEKTHQEPCTGLPANQRSVQRLPVHVIKIYIEPSVRSQDFCGTFLLVVERDVGAERGLEEADFFVGSGRGDDRCASEFGELYDETGDKQ